MKPDPKPAKRIVDPGVVKAYTQAARYCECCGKTGRISSHHILGKGGHDKGDDVPENLIALLGDGTTGCHGAFHRGDVKTKMRIGHAIVGRADVLSYLRCKLGSEAAAEYLQRIYLTSAL